jgi:hypothetical protein
MHLSLLLWRPCQRLRSVPTCSATCLCHTNTIFSSCLHTLQVDTTPIQSFTLETFTLETEYTSSRTTEHVYVGRCQRHVIRQGQTERELTCSHRGWNREQQRGIRTDRSNSHLYGPVPTTYPCPQPSSWLVQVLVVTYLVCVNYLL